MTATSPDRRGPAFLSGGPEGLAALLSVVAIVAVIALFSVSAGRPSEATPSASLPSASAPGPTPLATSPLASSTLPASGASPAPGTLGLAVRSLLAEDQRLLALRARLEVLLEEPTVRAATLVREIRSASTDLRRAQTLVNAVESGGLAPAVVAESRQLHAAAIDIVDATLRASITNDAAYRSGARQIVSALRPLEASMQRISIASGVAIPSGD